MGRDGGAAAAAAAAAGKQSRADCAITGRGVEDGWGEEWTAGVERSCVLRGVL